MKNTVYLLIFISIFALSFCGDDNSKDSDGEKLADNSKMEDNKDKKKDGTADKDGADKNADPKKGTKKSIANINDYLVDDLSFKDESKKETESKGRIRNLTDLKKVLEDDFYKSENLRNNPKKKWDNSVRHFDKYQKK